MRVIKEIVLKIFPNQDISDDIIVRTSYSLRKMYAAEELHDEDPMFLPEVESHLNKDYARKLASIPPIVLLQRLPLQVANINRFKNDLTRLNLSEDYKTIFTLVHVSRKFAKEISKVKASNDHYKYYCSLVKITGAKPLPHKSYVPLINSASFFEYDGLYAQHDISEGVSSAEHDNLSLNLSRLANDAYMTKDNRLRFALDCTYQRSIHNIINDNLDGKFKKLPKEELDSMLSEIQKEILLSPPLDCLKSLFIIKTTHYYAMDESEGETLKHLTDSFFSKTNAPIEMGLLYRLIRMDYPVARSGKIVTVDASPFMTQAIVEEDSGMHKTIVNKNPDVSDMLEFHYIADQRIKVPGGITIESLDRFTDLDLDNTSLSVILENSLTPGEIKQIVNYLKENTCCAIWVLCTDELAMDILLDTESEADAFIVPSKLYNNPAPTKKCILRLSSTEGNRIKIYSFTISKTNSNSIQDVTISTGREVDREILSRSNDSLRKLGLVPKNTTERKKRQIFMYSPEISFAASVPEANHNGDLIGKAYYLRDGKAVNETKVSYKLKNMTIEKWMSKVYPFRNISKRDGQNINVREIVGSYVRDDYRFASISLRTLRYIYPDIDEYIPSHLKDVLECLMTSKIGEMNPSFNTIDDFNAEIEGSFPEKTETWRCKAKDVIGLLTDFSCEKGHVHSERATQLFEALYDYKAGRDNISRMLSRRSLNKSKLRDILKHFQKVEPDSIRIALLVRLVTGIETDALCALNQEDFMLTNNNYRCFVIKKLCSFDGKKIIPVRRTQQSRIVPCTKEITQQIAQYCLTEDSKAPLFQIGGERISPEQVQKIIKDIVVKMGLDSSSAVIFDSKKVTRRVDLSEARKDLLRGNFSYWARKFNMFEDEVRFLLGVRCETSDGIHYIDFEAETSQGRLLRKMQLIEDFMLEKEGNS